MPKLPKPLSPGEEGLARDCACYKVIVTREYQFDKNRRWRADFFIQPNILVEVEGGSWTNGRHNRGSGMMRDCQKYNAAVLAGFRVFRFTTEQVICGEAIDIILQAVNQ